MLEKRDPIVVEAAGVTEAGLDREFTPYHCPRCGIQLDDRGAPSDCMLRCPNCGRPSVPPSQYRRRIVARPRSSHTTIDDVDAEIERPRKIGLLRILLWIVVSGLAGAIASVFMGSVFDTDAAVSNLAGLVTWVAVLLLLAIPRRKRRLQIDRTLQKSTQANRDSERKADLDRSNRREA